MAQQNRIGRTATTVRPEDGYTCVRYHYTDVVRFNDDEIILDTGGWFTQTTKTRMNQTANQYGLGFRVYQEDGGWFVMWNDDGGSWEPGAIEYEFKGNVLVIDRHAFAEVPA
ncbi:unnamed protein product [marine sediment metagenome]|uniref:Uncharacterized protein n=1 Tax=marine sediment metagenome TaxID=412755 RepID=X0Y044_9ZZZZ